MSDWDCSEAEYMEDIFMDDNYDDDGTFVLRGRPTSYDCFRFEKRRENKPKRVNKSKRASTENTVRTVVKYPDRHRCLTVGCNPKLFTKKDALAHKKSTGHRIAKWPVRSTENSANGYKVGDAWFTPAAKE